MTDPTLELAAKLREHPGAWGNTAADEIERLRAEIERLQAWNKELETFIAARGWEPGR